MTIWGKILGGAAGFALGGPLGGVIGAVAGHAVDRMVESPRQGEDGDATRQVAFTIGVIVLGAKMAKSDGRVTRDEVDAFKQVFHIPPEEMKNVGRLFDQARRDAHGFEPFARQLARMFEQEPAVLEDLLDGLFHIGRADGSLTPEELDYLARVAEIFGFSQEDWDRIRAVNMDDALSDPYRILGLGRDASDQQIKSAHRKLVLENHPDRLISQGVPQEFRDVASQKLAAINAAYDQIRKQRGL